MAERAQNQWVEAMEAGWRGFRAAVDRLVPDDLEQVTTSGWTAKAMLAHVAFWDETIEPVIVGMYRGGSLDRDWAFGSGYTHPDGPWPPTARHAAPRTTMRYDRARKNLDRHPNYILAAYMSSGT